MCVYPKISAIKPCIRFWLIIIKNGFVCGGIKGSNKVPELQIEVCPPFKPDAGFSENIFFIETADHLSGCLTPRAVCGIESTAKANPKMKVHVYIDTKVRTKKQVPVTKRGSVPSCSETDTLNSLPNVEIIKKDLRLVLNETKTWRDLEDELFMEEATEWTELHLKNSLKYILLKTHGGIYLDMNVVTYRALHCMRNTLLERFRSLSTEVMAFDAKHRYLGYLIRLITAKYEPRERECTGSPPLREAFNTFCNVSTASLKQGTYTCYKGDEVKVGDWGPFSPISRLHTLKYFGHYPDSESEILANFKSKSFLAYIDGANWGIPVPPTSPYGVLARHYCPTTWNAVRQAVPQMEF